MTLSALLSELSGLRLHALSETGVAAVRRDPHGLKLDFEEDGRDSEIAELRESEARLSAELAEVETEADALTRRVDHLEELIENAKDAENLQQATRDLKRMTEAATARALECRALQVELFALRKRKGLPAGLFANAADVLAYLHDSQDPKAQALVKKIHSV